MIGFSFRCSPRKKLTQVLTRASLQNTWRQMLGYLCVWLMGGALVPGVTAQAQEPSRLGSVNQVALAAELKSVKLFGAGGSGLDSFQSGFFITAEGHILTVWSTVLDVDSIIAVTSDGRRLEAKVVGIDPNLEIAVLATDEPTINYFDLAQAVDALAGGRVLAISNLYGIATGNEMSSVQKGVIMAKSDLKARRGSFESLYQGPVLIIDAMTNNPGAAGGSLTDMSGRLLGMLGKELRDASANIWLNYAIPIAQLRDSIDRILSGKAVDRSSSARKPADRPAKLNDLGIVLIPNVLAKTPTFVDLVTPESIADAAGLQGDDLILFINSVRVASQQALLDELKYIDRADAINLLVQRGAELKEIVLAL
jgi:serine protease Do